MMILAKIIAPHSLIRVTRAVKVLLFMMLFGKIGNFIYVFLIVESSYELLQIAFSIVAFDVIVKI